MIGVVLAAALAFGAGPGASSSGATSDDRAVERGLPDGPGRTVLEEKCIACHGADYVTQQRLTSAQWQRTVDKMRKFGARLSDDDAKVLSGYLAQHWPVGKPEHAPAPVNTPAAAVTPPSSEKHVK